MDNEKNFSENRNFWLLVAGQSIFAFGWAMPTLIRIPYFNWLGMTNSQVGLTGAAWGLCIIGNFLCPSLSRHFPRKKWFQFFITLPYLLADFAFGVTIVIAYMMHDYTWLIPMSLILAFFWPFAAGWYVVPLSEYTANCISKAKISTYVTAYQLGGAVMGFAGSIVMTYLLGHFGMPQRYAFGFLCAFGIAAFANMLPLLAHETPSPQPPPESFWRPAINAARYDRAFLRFLTTAFILWFIVLFPQLFMQMFAIREMGMPDQVAAAWTTAYTGATILGAVLTGLATRTIGYTKLLLAATMCFVAAMAIYCLPWSSEMRADSYFCSWTVRNGVTSPQIPKAGDITVPGNKSFVILGSELKPAKDGFDLMVRFNRDVSPQTFNDNDLNFKDPKGKRVPIASINKEDSTGSIWTARIKGVQKMDGLYSLQITPYIQDLSGNNLDMNGNGISPKDHYRFIPVGALYGLSFIGLGIALESLMYLFAPSDRRAGYFAAFRIIQFAAPALAFYASGLCFSPGNYKSIFMVLLTGALAAIWISHIILKPVQHKMEGFSAATECQEQDYAAPATQES